MRWAQTYLHGRVCPHAPAINVHAVGVALVCLKLGRPWIDNGTLVRLYGLNVPSPYAQLPVGRTGTMNDWERAAFAEWLHKAMV